MPVRRREETMTDSQAAAGRRPRCCSRPPSCSKLIPHRWPFLLVDRIVEEDRERGYIRGEKAVTASEWFFGGHFPDMPVMPGVHAGGGAGPDAWRVYVARRGGLRRAHRPLRRHRRAAASSASCSPVTASPRGHHGEAGPPLRQGPRGRIGRRRGRCEALISFVIPPDGRAAMTLRLALVSDIHGNVAALEAALAEIEARRARPHRHPRRPGPERPPPGRDRGQRSWSSRPPAPGHRRQHRYRRGRRRLRRRLPLARRGAGQPSRRRRVGTRAAQRRAARVPAPPARRAPAGLRRRARARHCHASPGQPDQRPARRSRRRRHRATRRRAPTPASSLRPHARRRRPRAGPQAAGQPRAPAATPSTARPTPAGACSRSRRARTPRPSSSAPATTPVRPPRRSPQRGLPGDVYRAATIRTGRFVR